MSWLGLGASSGVPAYAPYQQGFHTALLWGATAYTDPNTLVFEDGSSNTISAQVALETAWGQSPYRTAGSNNDETGVPRSDVYNPFLAPPGYATTSVLGLYKIKQDDILGRWNTYVTANHQTALLADMTALNNWATAATLPGEAEVSDGIDAIEAWTTAHLTGVDGWEGWLDAAAAKALEIYEGVWADIDDLVTAHEAALDTEHDRRVTAFTSAAWEARAGQNSQFVIGLALMESEKLRAVSDFRASLVAELARTRPEWVRGAVQDLGTRIMQEYDARKTNGLLRVDLGRLKSEFARTFVSTAALDLQATARFKQQVDQIALAGIADGAKLQIQASSDYFDRVLEVDVLDAAYDFEQLKLAGGVLGAVAGIPFPPDKPSRISSAIGSALTGAASLGAAGAAFGPMGMVVGALLGAAGGGAAGYLR